MKGRRLMTALAGMLIAVIVTSGQVTAASAAASAGRAGAGAGVQVAVIDSGIDTSHACFAEDGYPVVVRVGDDRLTSNKVPIARAYADIGAHALYPDGPIVGEDPTADPVQMHGTHVAGIIECRSGQTVTVGGRTLRIDGVAPSAVLASHVVFPGAGSAGVGPSDGTVARAIDQAVADGAQVINLSLSLPSASLTDAAIDRAWAAGVVVVVAAGNDGPGAGTIAQPADHPQAIAVGSIESGWVNEAVLRVAGRDFGGHVGTGVEVLAPVRASARVLPSNAEPGAAEEDVSNPAGLAFGCAAGEYAAAVDRVAVVARGRCTFSQKVTSAARAGALAVLIVTPDRADVTPLYTGGPKLPAMIVHPEAVRALGAEPTAEVDLLPADLRRLGTPGSLSEFSARGPTADGRIKPDVTAIGGGVLSASVPGACLAADTCVALESGTSMAAPAVAGMVAVVRSAHPDWSAAMVRSAVVHTARPIRGVPMTAQGAGSADLAQALTAPVGVGVLSLRLRPAEGTIIEVINPSDDAVRVQVGIETAPSSRATPMIAIAPMVEVGARGTSPLGVQAAPSSPAGYASLVLDLGSRSIRVPIVVGP